MPRIIWLVRNRELSGSTVVKYPHLKIRKLDPERSAICPELVAKLRVKPRSSAQKSPHLTDHTDA